MSAKFLVICAGNGAAAETIGGARAFMQIAMIEKPAIYCGKLGLLFAAMFGLPLVCGCSTKPPDVSELDVMAERIEHVPLRFGEWTGKVVEPDDALTCWYRKSQIRAHRDVEFSRPGTNQVVLVTLVCAPHRSVSRLTFGSYCSSGLEISDKKTSLVRLTDGGQATFRIFTVARNGAKTAHTFAWTYSHDGEWVAPQAGRIALAAQPNWYKLSVSVSTAGVTPSPGDVDSVESFAAEFLPALNGALF
jgi:hypothetical protein